MRVDSVQLGRATVSYDEKVADPSAIEAAISNAGYSASVLQAK